MKDNIKEVVYDLRERYGYSWKVIGDKVCVDRRTAKKYYEAYKGTLQEPRRDIKAPLFDYSRFKPLHVYGDAAVTCDWHVPLHSPRMVNSLFENIYKHNIHQLIIGGDLFNMDSFSHYMPHQPEARFELEREEATNLIDAALDIVDEVVLIWGNHDFRIVRKLDHQFSFEFCMRWVLAGLGEEKLKRVVISDLDHMIYHPGNYDLYICHPENFSSIPLSVARALAPKYQMSILTAHSHHFAQGVAMDGTNLLFDGGGLFSPARTEYIKRTNKHHRWVQGYYIWKDGQCLPYSPTYHNI